MFPATLLLMLLGWFAPASAHSALVASSPADGSTVSSIENGITLTFNEAIAEPAYVAVTAGTGEALPVDAEIDGAEVTAPLAGVVQSATKVTVAYRVVSADGHPVEGTIKFTYDPAGGTTSPTAPTTTAPTTVTPSPSATPTQPSTETASATPSATTPTAIPVPEETSSADSGGVPLWVWIVGVASIAALAAAAWLAFGKKDEDEPVAAEDAGEQAETGESSPEIDDQV
jgi:methionine-rich copper-binding protein CopC